jgi:hypothetical protein
MLLGRRVEIDTDDDTAGIYPRCIREADGSGRVERRERAIVQQKRAADSATIGVVDECYSFAISLTCPTFRHNIPRCGGPNHFALPHLDQAWRWRHGGRL